MVCATPTCAPSGQSGAPPWNNWACAKRPTAGTSRCRCVPHKPGCVSSKCRWTIAVALEVNPRCLAHSREPSWRVRASWPPFSGLLEIRGRRVLFRGGPLRPEDKKVVHAVRLDEIVVPGQREARPFDLVDQHITI